MGNTKEYNIQFGKLPLGTHQFEFKIDGRFFEQYPDSLITECETNTQLTLRKAQSNLLELLFAIEGNLQLECDRCLEWLPYPVNQEYKVLVKLENQEEDSFNDELLYLSPDAYELNVADLIYDFHILAIPFKKHCQEISSKCKEIEILLNEGTNEGDEDKTDPRWNELKKLLS